MNGLVIGQTSTLSLTMVFAIRCGPLGSQRQSAKSFGYFSGWTRFILLMGIIELQLRCVFIGNGEELAGSGWFLGVFFPADQLKIYPYNRVVRDLNGLTQAEFFARLGYFAEVTPGVACEPRPKAYK